MILRLRLPRNAFRTKTSHLTTHSVGSDQDTRMTPTHAINHLVREQLFHKLIFSDVVAVLYTGVYDSKSI